MLSPELGCSSRRLKKRHHVSLLLKVASSLSGLLSSATARSAESSTPMCDILSRRGCRGRTSSTPVRYSNSMSLFAPCAERLTWAVFFSCTAARVSATHASEVRHMVLVRGHLRTPHLRICLSVRSVCLSCCVLCVGACCRGAVLPLPPPLLLSVLYQARPAPRPVVAREYPHREALWKVLCSSEPCPSATRARDICVPSQRCGSDVFLSSPSLHCDCFSHLLLSRHPCRESVLRTSLAHLAVGVLMCRLARAAQAFCHL